MAQRGFEYEQPWVRRHYPDAMIIQPEFGYEVLGTTIERSEYDSLI